MNNIDRLLTSKSITAAHEVLSKLNSLYLHLRQVDRADPVNADYVSSMMEFLQRQQGLTRAYIGIKENHFVQLGGVFRENGLQAATEKYLIAPSQMG